MITDTPTSSHNELAPVEHTIPNERGHDHPLSPVAGGDTCADGIHVAGEGNPYLFPLDLFSRATAELATLQSADSVQANLLSDNSSSSNGVYNDRPNGPPRWWLLHTKSRQEKKLAEHLAGLNVAHYLPVTKHRAMTRGKERVSQVPLFSGYMFLFGTTGQRRLALETNRVVSVHEVVEGKEFCERLMLLAELIAKDAPLTAEAQLSAGRVVRVKSGVFKDKQGTVLMRAGKTRLFVFVNELLGGVSMEIDEHLLEPIY